MNYFGLFFSFTLPGIIIGILIAVAVAQGLAARRRTEQMQQPRKRGLYIENIKEEAQHEA
jgi:hypothetical protein